MIRKIRESGARPPPELQRFTGRVGSPTAVEAAFGGRFIDRQPQRWHRFEDHDAPLAADSFDAFVSDVASGTWDPRPDVDDETHRVGGAALVEEAAIRGARWSSTTSRSGSSVRRCAGRPTGVPRGWDAGGEASRWTSREGAAQKRDRGLLGGGHLAAQAGVRQAAGCLLGGGSLRCRVPTCQAASRRCTCLRFPLSHGQIARMYRPCGDGSRRLRIRDAGDVVTLPARVPGNLPGVTVHEVKRPLSEVLVGFHELLAGPTEPDMTQAIPTQAAPGSGAKTPAVPNAAATWSFDLGAKISVGAAAPGSRARIAAAAAACFCAADTQEEEEEGLGEDEGQEEEEEAVVGAQDWQEEERHHLRPRLHDRRPKSREREEAIHRDRLPSSTSVSPRGRLRRRKWRRKKRRRRRRRRLSSQAWPQQEACDHDPDTGDKSTAAVAPGQETQDCAGALQDLAPTRPRRGGRGKPADPEPGKRPPPKTKAARGFA